MSESLSMEITLTEYYLNTLRPYLDEMMINCKFDVILIKSLEHAKMRLDEYISKKQTKIVLNEMSDVLQSLLVVIESPEYLKNQLKRATSKEQEFVHTFITKLHDMSMIIRYTEPEKEEAKTPLKNRIGYDATARQNENVVYQYSTSPVNQKRF